MAFGPAELDRNVAPLVVPGFAQALPKAGQLSGKAICYTSVKKSDDRHRRLLRAGGKWPPDYCAAEKRYKFAPPHRRPAGLETMHCTGSN
jgi:hypothetical protein